MRDGLREVESAAKEARAGIASFGEGPLYQGMMRLGGPIGNAMFRLKGLADTVAFFAGKTKENNKVQEKQVKTLKESAGILRVLYGRQHAAKMIAVEENKVQKEKLELLAKEVGGKGKLFKTYKEEMKFLEKRYIRLRDTGQLEKAGKVLGRMKKTTDTAREVGLINEKGKKNFGLIKTPFQKIQQRAAEINIKVATLQKRGFNFLASLPSRTISLVFRGLAKLVIAGLIGFGLIIAAIYLFRKPLMNAFKDTAKLKRRVEQLKDTLIEFYDSYLKPVVEAGVKLFKALADPTKTFDEVLSIFGDFILTGLANLVAFAINEIIPRLADFLPKVFAFLLNTFSKFIKWFSTFDFSSFFEKLKVRFAASLQEAGLSKNSDGYKKAMSAFASIMTIARIILGLSQIVIGITQLLFGIGQGIGAVAMAVTGRFGKMKQGLEDSGKSYISAGKSIGAGSRNIVGLATGGTVTKSGAFLVGERGPELVNLPKGSAVTPNGGGNTIHVHVNGRLGASENELRDIARRVGQMVSREMNRSTSTGVRL